MKTYREIFLAVYQHSSEMFETTCETTWCHNPEDHDQRLQHHENFKSQRFLTEIIDLF
jgi:hypothetical protein